MNGNDKNHDDATTTATTNTRNRPNSLGGPRVETQLRPENPCTLNNFRKATLSLSCLILSFNMSKIVYAGTTLTKNSIIFLRRM